MVILIWNPVCRVGVLFRDSNRIWTHNHLVLKPTLNHLAKLAFCQFGMCRFGLMVKCSFTNWLWFRILLLSLKYQILRLFRAKSSLAFGQPYSVDSPWNAYVTWRKAWIIRSIFNQPFFKKPFPGNYFLLQFQ